MFNFSSNSNYGALKYSPFILHNYYSSKSINDMHFIQSSSHQILERYANFAKYVCRCFFTPYIKKTFFYMVIIYLVELIVPCNYK